MNNVEVLQHNFETIKPESIFTSIIQDEDMNKSIIDEIRKTGDVQDYKTNVKAYMTDWDMKGKPGFDKLEKIIIDMTKYLSKIYYNRKIEPKVSDMWGMIYKKGDYAMVHDHWPSLWSGVYYIEVPDNSGDLYFPQLKQTMTPKNNQVIVFEGKTRHGVRESLSDKERIAVSFNVKETI
jgi:hypothetical protein